MPTTLDPALRELLEPVRTPPPADAASARLVELDLADLAAAPSGDGAPPINRRGMPAVLRLAHALHADGHLAEAEPIYRRILAVEPDHGDALHGLGLVLLQRGEAESAIPSLRRAALLGPMDTARFRHLGEAFRQVSAFDAAARCFRRALEIDPTDADSMCNLAHVHFRQGRLEEAERGYRAALARRPEDTGLLTCLGAVLSARGRSDEATRRFDEALALDPGNVTARHLRASARHEPVRSAPRAYIRDLFDDYADTFDEHLVGTLAYDAPARLRAAVESVTDPAHPRWRVIDLGCGTGLCGLAFRSHADELIGVDLAPRMIRQARRRNIYDVLIEDDLTAALDPEVGGVDLVVAGDVFLYVGDLAEVFRHCARALRPGGLFAFSTERAEGDAFELRASGRFAHADAYIRRMAGAHGFAVARADDITLRVEQGHGLAGQVFVLART